MSFLGIELGGAKFKVSIYPKDDELSGFEFDAMMSETHTGEAEISSHPIEGDEDGNISDVTDHIRRKADVLQLSGIVTNTPVVFLASLNATPINNLSDPAERAEAAYEMLNAWKNTGEILAVATKLKTYTSMAISSISVTKDKDTGNILDVSLSLQEVLVARTETVASPKLAKKNRGRSTKEKKGAQSKSAAGAKTAEKANSTLAVKGIKFIKSLF